VLSELRERNNLALSELSNRVTSDNFKRGDDVSRAGLIDSGNRLRAIEAEITEAMLHMLRKCDAEWGFAGRLHEAFRAEANFERDWQQRLAQHGAHWTARAYPGPAPNAP